MVHMDDDNIHHSPISGFNGVNQVQSVAQIDPLEEFCVSITNRSNSSTSSVENGHIANGSTVDSTLDDDSSIGTFVRAPRSFKQVSKLNKNHRTISQLEESHSYFDDEWDSRNQISDKKTADNKPNTSEEIASSPSSGRLLSTSSIEEPVDSSLEITNQQIPSTNSICDSSSLDSEAVVAQAESEIRSAFNEIANISSNFKPSNDFPSTPNKYQSPSSTSSIPPPPPQPSSMNFHASSTSSTCSSTTRNPDEDGDSIMLLEPRSFRPFKSSEDYLYAMREDLAEWLNAMYDLNINADNFFEVLETGEVLCQVSRNYLFHVKCWA